MAVELETPSCVPGSFAVTGTVKWCVTKITVQKFLVDIQGIPHAMGTGKIMLSPSNPTLQIPAISHCRGAEPMSEKTAIRGLALCSRWYSVITSNLGLKA